MKKIEFDVLLYLYENDNVSIEEMSAKLFNKIDTINLAIEYLEKCGYISNNVITNSGINELNKYKIDNAIILAAGMSTRFVPLNYETPKGLLKVKGEVLIERQIRQLMEKGIEEIIIVVGYMKEKFEYLKRKYGVKIVCSPDFETKNNYSSVYAAREYLKNSIITSSDLYFTENIFQRFAYDSYYTCVYFSGKTAERGIVTDDDDKIIKTMYGDSCYDIWCTLGYAFFSEKFSKNILSIIEPVYNDVKMSNKFWADIQDDHLEIINEFDSLEELREFDNEYMNVSGSKIMHKICYLLAVREKDIIKIETLKKIKKSMFRFYCKGNYYICDVENNSDNKISYLGRMYYQCKDENRGDGLKMYKLDKNIKIGGKININIDSELNDIYEASKDFVNYHKRALPLCAAENVISDFANLPLTMGFQERYIMNNTYSFNMDDNFIGCEKLFPFYQKLSEVCGRIFNAKFVDPRPFTGMHCIDMVTKTLCKPGDKMIILGKEYGGHASVKPVVERLGIVVYDAPYILEENDIDYEKLNRLVKDEGIKFILLAPSDIIKPLNVEKIDTTNCVLLWDCSQLMGLIAAGLCNNPLKTMKNVVMFGGTHKTFPGPASGLILTNDEYLHEMMETEINPKLTRHSQMHQKISLLFAMIEFEKFGTEYMSHMLHCSNYLGEKLKELGYDVADIDGQISSTHQIFIRCSKEMMDTIYDNAYKFEVTLNKKHKELFKGYGIRLGTQEISRYDWNDSDLDKIATIIFELSKKLPNDKLIAKLKNELPEKKVKYTFSDEIVKKFKQI